MKQICMVLSLAGCAAFAAPMHETFENSHFKMVLDPLGGRIRSLYSKDAGVDLTVPTNAAGLFTESSWDRWHSRGKLANAVFDVKCKIENVKCKIRRFEYSPSNYSPFEVVGRLQSVRFDSYR